jgi:hypothetical protein
MHGSDDPIVPLVNAKVLARFDQAGAAACGG